MMLLRESSPAAQSNCGQRAPSDYLERALAAFPASAVRGLPVPPEFAARTSDTVPVVLEFRDFELSGLGRLRFTGIQGRSSGIFSLMIFPNDPRSVPVFASEFVVFGQLVRAAVLDFQGLADEVRASRVWTGALDELARAFPGMTAQEELPGWCRAHFTPQAVFRLRAKAPELAQLDSAFDAWIDRWAAIASGHVSHAPAVEAPELAEYKRHHVANTPGRPFLERCFGTAWTERFLRDGMYAGQGSG